MSISYEIYEPPPGSDVVVLQSLSDQIKHTLTEVPTRWRTPAAMLAAAVELCREAFTTLDAGALRTDPDNGIVHGRPVTLDELGVLEDAVMAAARVESVAQAVGAIAMARYAAVDQETVDGDTGFAEPVEHPLGHQAMFADTDLGAACGMAPRTASSKLSTAVTVCTKTPGLLKSVVEGDTPFWKASTVASELINASDATARRVEEQVLNARGFDTWGVRRVQSSVRAMLVRCEPAAAKESRQRSIRTETGVFAEPAETAGLSRLTVTGPAKQVAEMYAALEQLAQEWVKHPEQRPTTLFDQDDDAPGSAGTTGTGVKPTLGQVRFQALHALITGNSDVSYQVVFHIPVHRDATGDSDAAAEAVAAQANSTAYAADHDARSATNEADDGSPPPGRSPYSPRGPDTSDDSGYAAGPGLDADSFLRQRSGSTSAGDSTFTVGWASVPGVGFVDPDTVAALVERFGAKLTRALVDAKTGVTAETSTITYRPTSRIRGFVHLRDGCCRFPGCSRPATRSDLDHVTEWPAGDTTGSNLAALCRRHHEAKTKGHWDYTMTADGVCTWTSRTGRVYLTHPLGWTG